MQRTVVPVDGAASAEHAVKHVIAMWVHHRKRTALGDGAPEIALYADVHDCAEIVMGRRGRGTTQPGPKLCGDESTRPRQGTGDVGEITIDTAAVSGCKHLTGRYAERANGN